MRRTEGEEDSSSRPFENDSSPAARALLRAPLSLARRPLSLGRSLALARSRARARSIPGLFPPRSLARARALSREGGSAGPLFEGKTTTWEGGVRVPGIISWPGKIAPGRVSAAVVATYATSLLDRARPRATTVTPEEGRRRPAPYAPAATLLPSLDARYDIFSTMLALAGVPPPADGRAIDGRDLTPLLLLPEVPREVQSRGQWSSVLPHRESLVA